MPVFENLLITGLELSQYSSFFPVSKENFKLAHQRINRRLFLHFIQVCLEAALSKLYALLGFYSLLSDFYRQKKDSATYIDFFSSTLGMLTGPPYFSFLRAQTFQEIIFFCFCCFSQSRCRPIRFVHYSCRVVPSQSLLLRISLLFFSAWDTYSSVQVCMIFFH